MNEIKNFLTGDECLELIEMINDNNHPSSVVEAGEDISKVSSTRTSSTCNLDPSNETVKKLHEKISNFLGIEMPKGEQLQGQLYEEGQYFRPHQDFFTGSAYDKHCLHSGNRTDTFMIYLNEDFEGGGTDFPRLNITVSPETGKAVHWKNMINGECQESAMHEGMPITKGRKYIITSWWRENEWDNYQDNQLFINKAKVYTEKNQIPKLTEKGFKVVKVPTDTWEIIKEAYEILKNKKTEEVFAGKEDIITSGGSDIYSFENLKSIRSLIHKQLQPIHEEFCGANIEPSFIYGIRSYRSGATLVKHVDRVETHHISSIIIVGKDLRCGCPNREFGDDWPLDIQSHDGEWHKVYAEPGDMILYESAICEHGRVEPFQGTSFDNFFVHYKLI